MKKEELQNILNKEYANIGTIQINKMHEDIIEVSDVKYIASVMEAIEPLENPTPIIVATSWGLSGKYKIIDGYHRIKHKLINKSKKVDVIVLDSYAIARKNDTLFDFMSGLVGKTIKFINDENFILEGKYYQIECNEGCGGCSSGWSEIQVKEKFIGKEIIIETVESVEEDNEYENDKYDLKINGEIVAKVDTGWGNGYYGGDFKINLLS